MCISFKWVTVVFSWTQVPYDIKQKRFMKTVRNENDEHRVVSKQPAQCTLKTKLSASLSSSHHTRRTYTYVCTHSTDPGKVVTHTHISRSTAVCWTRCIGARFRFIKRHKQQLKALSSSFNINGHPPIHMQFTFSAYNGYSTFAHTRKRLIPAVEKKSELTLTLHKTPSPLRSSWFRQTTHVFANSQSCKHTMTSSQFSDSMDISRSPWISHTTYIQVVWPTCSTTS